MRELNDDWRDLRESTDVLSFPGESDADRPCGMYCLYCVYCILVLHVLCDLQPTNHQPCAPPH